ncbi:hypothetical protein QE152_g27776 [Popillia japonica]|uniref:Transposase n=1 Tax=Popillia japonica TaxID=7064 RepID=A0AAW1JLY3_POPJA
MLVESVAEWKLQIADIIKEYKLGDIATCDETGLFSRQCASKVKNATEQEIWLKKNQSWMRSDGLINRCGITHDGDKEVNENVEEIAEDTNEIEELVTEINPRCNVHDCIEEIAEDTNEIEELVTEINPRCNVHDCIT